MRVDAVTGYLVGVDESVVDGAGHALLRRQAGGDAAWGRAAVEEKETAFDRLARSYRGFAAATLRVRPLVIIGALLLFAGSAYGLLNLGRELLIKFRMLWIKILLQ